MIGLGLLIMTYGKQTILARCNSNLKLLYADSTPLSPILSPQDVDNLRMGQRRLTEMLRIFDEICVNNGVAYFVIGGTLLGAFA